MVGILSCFLLANGLCSGAFAVSFRVSGRVNGSIGALEHSKKSSWLFGSYKGDIYYLLPMLYGDYEKPF